MKFHPAAEIFPLLCAPELKRLSEDIAANGLNQPIITFKGMILDGRNRFLACQSAGVKPKFAAWDNGASPTVWVVSQNLHRRHLTDSQKAAVAVEVEAMLAKEIPKGRPKKSLTNERVPIWAARVAGKSLGVSNGYVSTAKQIARKSPKLLQEVKSGKKTLRQAKAEVDAAEDKKKMAVALKVTQLPESCDIRHCSMAELFASGIQPDAVITDPPYPEAFLPLYGELARAAQNVPLVAVMCGQSHLPQILALMCPHLQYRWTLAYLTPGGQAVQLWDRHVNTFWKPVLLFGAKPPSWIGDVVSSDTNDNDKRLHGWGQSESGFSKLIQRLSDPGHLICDPFLGGGTTALCSLALGRRFIGCDTEKQAVETSRGRIAQFLHERTAQ